MALHKEEMLGQYVTTPEQLKLESALQQALGTDSGRCLGYRAVKGQPQVAMAWIPPLLIFMFVWRVS